MRWLAVLTLLIAAPLCQAQDVPLSLEGAGVSKVKIDKVVVVKEDATIVTAFPCTLKAPAGGILYQWSFPPSVDAVRRSNALELRGAPKGPLTISVDYAVVDFDKKTVESRSGVINFFVGDVPTPGPTPPPVPPPPPAPIIVGLRVLIVEEATERTKLPAAQVLVLTGKPMHDWLNEKCMADPQTASGKAWAVWDKDVDAKDMAKAWQTMLAAAKGQAMPCVIVAGGDGTVVFKGPLPADAAVTQVLITQYLPKGKVGFNVMLYPNEMVIHDGNVHEHAEAVHFGDDGKPRSRGLVPRNLETHPLGCYKGIKAHTAVNFPLIPRSEWPERLRDQIAAGARCSDHRLRGNNGQPIPSRDQGQRGYCWRHSPTSAQLLARAGANLPYVDLSAYAGACRIKNYRDEGGWGAQGLDDVIENGDPSSEFWPQRATDRKYDTPAMRENARLHRAVEGWIDLASAQYDRKLSFDQEFTLYLVTKPCVKDENWWSHSIAGADGVDGAAQWKVTRSSSGKLMALAEFEAFWGIKHEVTGGYGVRIWNSWGDTWSAQGMGVLTGNQAISDGCVGLLTTTLSIL